MNSAENKIIARVYMIFSKDLISFQPYITYYDTKQFDFILLLYFVTAKATSYCGFLYNIYTT